MFSGHSAEAPRWAMTQGRPGGGSIRGRVPAADTIDLVQVYNTLGRALEPLRTRAPGEVTMYTCGPTVQSAPHVGHGRQAVAFDVIRRYLEWRGYRVTYVTNITDIEDKIINAAAEQGISTVEVASRATAQFLDAYRRLGVRPPDRLCYATLEIPRMLDLISRLVGPGPRLSGGRQRLLLRGLVPRVREALRSQPRRAARRGAHRTGRGEAPPRRLRPVEGLQARRALLGLALGAGPPGLAHRMLGDGPGGARLRLRHPRRRADLIFPHHENEIAQSEAAAGAAPFARYWLHNGMVNLRGEKMAKSTGNVVSLLDLLDRYPPLAVRLFYLRAHYRAPLDYFEEALADSAASLERLWAFRRRAGRAGALVGAAVARFAEAMDDDFNTAGAMGVLFDLVREGHRRLDEGEDAGPQAAAYDTIVGVLGLAEPASGLDDLAGPLGALATAVGVEAGEPAATLEALIARRAQARAEAAWALGDQIRDRLGALGIVLEDGADGTVWRRR